MECSAITLSSDAVPLFSVSSTFGTTPSIFHLAVLPLSMARQ